MDHGHVTLALLHLLLSVQHDLKGERRENSFHTWWVAAPEDVISTCRACACASAALYRGSEVDGHQRVRRQEKVVKSQGVFEVGEHVAEPSDEPRQRKDGPHLSSDESRRKKKHLFPSEKCEVFCTCRNSGALALKITF